MIAYMSFEWLKLTKRWMPRIILFLMLCLTVLVFWGQGSRLENQGDLFLPRGWLAALIYASFFAPFFWPVLGGSWAGNEYGWGTIRMILTRRPYRIQHALGALSILLIGVALALVAMLLVGSVAGFLVGVLTGNGGFTSGVLSGEFLGTVLKSFLAAWYVGAFYLILAYTAATVFRSAAVGIGIGIGSTLAEVVLRGIFTELGGTWKDIAQHFPVVYTQDMARLVAAPQLIPGTSMASVGSDLPGIGESTIVLAIYMAILLAITLVALRTRDVTA
jgi:ABC-2 type transport system permease protein